MSSKNNKVLKIIGAVAVIVIVWLILDNVNKGKVIVELKKKNDEKDDVNEKLHKTIEESKDIPTEVKKQLELLVEKYRNVNNDVKQELLTASSLIEIKQYPKAIAVLTKIIENLLKEKYAKDEAFQIKTSKKGFPTLKDFLDQAKADNLLSSEEYHFANALREIRNSDAHNLNPSKSHLLTSSAFLTSVDLILKISAKKIGLKKSSRTTIIQPPKSHQPPIVRYFHPSQNIHAKLYCLSCWGRKHCKGWW